MTQTFDEAKIRAALAQAWSLETAKQWTAQTPAAGQCNVTAVLIQEMFGGEIRKTPLDGYTVPHFYNVIAGRRVDLTDSQFDAPIPYADQETDSTTAMGWVTPAELDTLRARLVQALS